ncbi:hypothetical protein KP509_31G014800 [Ceratopteris richardii]|nr:hypothetical protein KP509_31G014800 [Ceratopteris richardii]
MLACQTPGPLFCQTEQVKSFAFLLDRKRGCFPLLGTESSFFVCFCHNSRRRLGEKWGCQPLPAAAGYTRWEGIGFWEDPADHQSKEGAPVR